MSLDQFMQSMLPAIETELQANVGRVHQAGLEGFHSMMAYHLGWEGEGAGPEARGKRIRPLLVLLTSAAAGKDWSRALPVAAAVELIHNFSLIHDDIEDNSPLRRGRRTVWNLWGVPQAINVGDGMFTLAHLAALRLSETVSPAAALRANIIIQEACLHLTQGQYLDISYEGRNDLNIDAYWPMVSGKTAALLAACTELGAVSAEAEPERCKSYRQFGRMLGLAFQAQDDLLGIWGDAEVTGKSAESDLVSGKKSLPVLYGLGLEGPFARRWKVGPITSDEVPALAALLEQEGGRTYTLSCANQLTEEALTALDQAHPQGDAGQALRTLALKLLQRKS